MAKVYKVLNQFGEYIREYSDEKVAKGFASKVHGRTVVEAKGKKEVKPEPIKEEIIDFDIEIKETEEEKKANALKEVKRASMAKARAKKGKAKKK